MEVRLARLEGSYEQVDRRLGVIDDRLARLEAKIDALGAELNARIDRFTADLGARMDGLSGSLSGRIDRLEGRMYALLFGIIVAVLVPIAIRIFFP